MFTSPQIICELVMIHTFIMEYLLNQEMRAEDFPCCPELRSAPKELSVNVFRVHALSPDEPSLTHSGRGCGRHACRPARLQESLRSSSQTTCFSQMANGPRWANPQVDRAFAYRGHLAGKRPRGCRQPPPDAYGRESSLPVQSQAQGTLLGLGATPAL